MHMQWMSHCRLAACFACFFVFSNACTIIPKDPVTADHEILPDYHFYSACGQARICGDLTSDTPGKEPGYYLVYVLSDSLDVNNCVSGSETISGRDTLPMRFGRDFLITMAVHEGGEDWFFQLQQMNVLDSMLHIHLKAYHREDTTVSKPSYALSDNYVWKVNGQGAKLIKLYINSNNYAYVPGPQWSEAPVNWEHAHWGESPLP